MTADEKPAGFEGGREFRLPRHYLWTGIVCTAMFSAAGGVSVYAAWTNIDGSFPHPKETAVIFGVFWGVFTLLGVWILRAALHERLIVSTEEVTMVGSLYTRSVRVEDVTRVVWRTFGGKLTLHSPETRVVIWLQNFPEMAELRAFFRAAWPEDIQEGWEQFSAVHRPPTPAQRMQAARVRKWIYAFLLANGVAFVAVAIWNPLNDPADPWKFSILGAVNLVVGGLALRWELRRPKTPAEQS